MKLLILLLVSISAIALGENELTPEIGGYTLHFGKGPTYPETLMTMSLQNAAYECDEVPECKYFMFKEGLSSEGLYQVMFAMGGSPIEDMKRWFVYEKDSFIEEQDDELPDEQDSERDYENEEQNEVEDDTLDNTLHRYEEYE